MRRSSGRARAILDSCWAVLEDNNGLRPPPQNRDKGAPGKRKHFAEGKEGGKKRKRPRRLTP
eukprot:8791101-Pyramimonas_sp.AAC.1